MSPAVPTSHVTHRTTFNHNQRSADDLTFIIAATDEDATTSIRRALHLYAEHLKNERLGGRTCFVDMDDHHRHLMIL